MVPERQTLTLYHQDAATTDKTTYVAPALEGSWEVVGINFVPDGDGAVTIDATEWRKITYTVGSTDIAQITTDTDGTPAGAAWVAGTPVTFGTALNGAAAVPISTTTPLKVASLHNGATGRVCKGVSTITIERRRV